MPIPVQQFQRWSLEDADPYQAGLNNAIQGSLMREQARAQAAAAAKQEALNPNVAREQLADILKKEIENKYAPRDKEATIKGQELANQYLPQEKDTEAQLRRSQSRHLNAQSDYIPLDSFIKANDSLRANSRFGKNYEFIRSINAMDSGPRAAWIAQHQDEWNQRLSDLASDQSGSGSTSNNDSIAEAILKNELLKISKNFNPNVSNSNISNANAITRANQDQNKYDQTHNIAQPNVAPSGTPLPNTGNAPVTNNRSPIQESIAKTLPVEDQPKSNDPDIQQAQNDLNKAKFSSTRSQTEQIRDMGLINASLKNSSAANKSRVDGAKVTENFLKNLRTPENIKILKNVAKMSGQTGAASRKVQEYLPAALQSDAYKDYLYYEREIVPTFSNLIKQMEKLNGDQRQRAELNKMTNILYSPELGEKDAIKAFNRSIANLQDMSHSIFDSVEIPGAKGVFKRSYNLPDKYKEYIPPNEKKTSSKSDLDKSIADLDKQIAAIEKGS